MKKAFFLVMTLAFPFLASAQVEKGNVFLGGTLSFSTISGDGTTPYNVKTTETLSPRVGFFLSNKSAIGGGVDITYQKYFGDMSSHTAGLAFFHRLYLPITESFFFVLHSEVGGALGKRDGIDGVGTSSKTSSLFIRTGPHFAYFATRHWQFEASVGVIGLSSLTLKPDADLATNSTSTTFSFNAGSVGLGVYYYFRK